jgi:uncharacterized protein (TIGR02453 family)
MAEAAAPPEFAGFPPEAFGWFAGLEADNSKAYFTAHRDTFDGAVRGALEAMLFELAAEFGGSVRMFRPNRDVRFSPDKSPYKTTTYGVIGERPGGAAPLYAQLSARGLFAGTGYHMLERDQLERLREGVAAEHSGRRLEAAVAAAEAAGVEIFGQALKTAPRGYAADHPRVGLLRHKALFGGRRLDPGPEGIGREAALDHARSTWSACAPLNEWLDTYVGHRRW